MEAFKNLTECFVMNLLKGFKVGTSVKFMMKYTAWKNNNQDVNQFSLKKDIQIEIDKKVRLTVFYVMYFKLFSLY